MNNSPHNLNTIYVLPHGIGDGMMGTAVAREYHKRFGKPMHIGHLQTELFQNNPNVICHPEFAFSKITPKLIKQAALEGLQLICLYYFDFLKISSTRHRLIQHQNITYTGKLLQRAGFSGVLDIIPEIYLSETECAFGQYFPGKKQIAIISGGIDDYKHWPIENLQQIISNYPEYNFVQLGTSHDKPLSGVLDLRGQLTLRQIAGVLNNSRLLIGETGGLMHIARAVNCPAVILSPSFEPGNLYYKDFNYVLTESPCTKCHDSQLNFFMCQHPEVCTSTISVEQAINAINQALSSQNALLHQEFENIPPSSDLSSDMGLWEKVKSASKYDIEILCPTHNNPTAKCFHACSFTADNHEYSYKFSIDLPNNNREQMLLNIPNPQDIHLAISNISINGTDLGLNALPILNGIKYYSNNRLTVRTFFKYYQIRIPLPHDTPHCDCLLQFNTFLLEHHPEFKTKFSSIDKLKLYLQYFWHKSQIVFSLTVFYIKRFIRLYTPEWIVKFISKMIGRPYHKIK